jgi:small subunit ribosomal protein S20
MQGGFSVANHKSALKRAKQTEKRYARNKAYRTRLKNILKEARLFIENEENKEAVEQHLKNAERLIQKIHTKGIIHKNKASRLISRLYKKAHTKAS